jgi:N6-L-threonylcarbamoyladenine synthase
VAAFDIQKIRNPQISGVDYRDGAQKDFWNVREYVLYRDNHTCQHCKGKSKDPVLAAHHRDSRQTGGDRPENLLTLCTTCHSAYHAGKIVLKTGKPSKGFKAETFMTIVRWKLVDKLSDTGDATSHTYGYITKSARIALGLPKSHINDAFTIAGGSSRHRRVPVQYLVRQVRKCNRKLRRGDRSHLINTAPRFVRGFQRYDKVLWKGIECFIFGRRTSGYFDLKKLDGAKVCATAKASEITLIESAKTLLIERTRIPLHAGVTA